jgi:DNA-binding MarR family transcriptional regulator
MTNRVDRLAARGLVQRDNHPDDRRGVLVQLTDSGRAKVDAALTDLLVAEQTILTPLSPVDQDQLVGILRRLLSRASAPSRTAKADR